MKTITKRGITAKATAIIAAAAASLIGIAGLAGTANAGTPDPSITLNAAQGETLAGHTFDFYQLGTYQDTNESGSGTVSDVTIKDVTALGSWLEQGLSSQGVTVPTGLDPAAIIAEQNGSTLRGIALNLARNTAGKTPSLAGATSSDASHKFTLPSEGLYLIVDAQGSPIIVGTKIGGEDLAGSPGLGIAYIKSNVVNVDKKVLGSDGTTWLDNGSGTVGETQKYQAKFSLPNKLAYKDGVVKDTPTGLTYTPGTFKATIDGTDVTDQFTLDETAPGFTATMKDTLIQNYENKQVTITYDGVLTDNSADNRIDVTFNPLDNVLPPNTPNPTGGDDVKVETYKFDLKKVSSKNDATTVAGAGFKIHDDTNNVWLSWDAANGKWNTTANENDAQELTTGSDGLIHFTDLGAGKYTISETTVPSKYVSFYKPSFTVDIDDQGGAATTANQPIIDYVEVPPASSLSAGGSMTVTVKNAPDLTSLPLTGGAALGMVVIALAILGGGVVLFVSKKNKQKVIG